MKVSDYTFPLFVRKRPADKPNILLLFTDQQRFDTINALGFDYMVTPNLNRLVREGCAFTHACTPNPVCIPARHSLLTGQYSAVHGMAENYGAVIPPQVPRLPRLLADDGYHCELVGKTHFTPPRTHHGFHRMQIMEELFHNVGDDDYATYLQSVGQGHVRNVHGIRNMLYVQPQRSLIPEEHHGSSWVAERSADCIRRNSRRPFFLWSSWIAPHPPFDVPDSFADLYKGADLPEPTPREERANPRLENHRLAGDYEDPAKTRRVRELYFASISFVDHNIGKVLAALEETDQLENTLILFTSDHGEMLGDNGGWGKQLPNDFSRRVPLIARYPARIPAGTIRHDHADLLDILPTCLDAAGVEPPADADFPGESILIAEGQGKRDRTVHYMENGRGQGRVISLRGQRFKLNYWFDTGREELYDLQQDPAEIRNLLDADLAPEAASQYADLKRKLTDHESQHGWPDTVRDGKLVPWQGEKKETWPPSVAGLNWQFHTHPFNMPPEEGAKYQSEKTEVLQATKDEPALKLSRLNLDYYLSAGGDAELVEEIRRRDL
jgi:arylsulfatase A-like enzyme